MAEGGAMEELVELAWLLDFYGALLTEKRRRIVEMRVNEDMTLAEIADACQMTRQGAYDAFAQARKQLKAYEATLGLAGRYRQTQAALAECRLALDRVEAAPGAQADLMAAKRALEQIEKMER